jgi:hypothetical protein
LTKIDYEKQAAECLRMAQRMPLGEQKALLLSMARSWQALAEKAQRVQALAHDAISTVATDDPNGQER